MSSTFIDTQEWIPIHSIPGFEACIEYYINREGKVKSSKGTVERLLKHIPHNSGYPSVKLTQRIGKGKVITVLIHKLVAFAFLDSPPLPYGQKVGHCCIDHIDEDKSNCNASNLRWVTIRENNTKAAYQRRPKNTPEQAEAAKERQRISKRDYMRRQRVKQKEAKIEESNN